MKRDFDPEDDQEQTSTDSDVPSEPYAEKEKLNGGREHYEIVSTSKLRKPDHVRLDAKYSGLPIRRDALNSQGTVSEDDPVDLVEEEEDEDPFSQKPKDSTVSDQSNTAGTEEDISNIGSEAIDEDDEIDSDEAFGEGDIEKFRNFSFRGSKANQKTEEDSISEISSDGEDESDTEISEDEEEHLDMENATDEDVSGSGSGESSNEDTDTDDDEPASKRSSKMQKPVTTRDEVRALLSNDMSTITSSLTDATTADVSKGRAVKQQQQIFDRLLDARIKLQKGLTAANEMPSARSDNSLETDADAALNEAENAALKLLSTIESMREMMSGSMLTPTSASQPSPRKRKRVDPVLLTTTSSEIGVSIRENEIILMQSRRAILDKWATKIRASDPTQVSTSVQSKLRDQNSAQQQPKLSSVLDTYLLSEQDKLFTAATRGMRTSSSNELPSYDDIAFYQTLLRDLVTSRSASTSLGADVPVVPMKLHPSGNKAKANGKVIDTRASKGRKIRYTVHEKLQNFMASQGDVGRDTSQWTEAAKREFFGSLMGQSRALDEADSDHDVDMGENEDDQSREMEALRLFRS